jgi:hypothetical protein
VTAASDPVARLTDALDRVDALGPGHGQVELGVLLRGGVHEGQLGAHADLQRRFSDSLSAFATADVGVAWDSLGRRLGYAGLGGVRWRF